MANYGVKLQKFNAVINQNMWNDISEMKKTMISEVALYE